MCKSIIFTMRENFLVLNKYITKKKRATNFFIHNENTEIIYYYK